jgi:hypothetical protein
MLNFNEFFVKFLHFSFSEDKRRSARRSTMAPGTPKILAAASAAGKLNFDDEENLICFD